MQRIIPVFLLFIIIGCTSSHTGLRVRAQTPAIEEAFRKLSLALNIDGFEINHIDAAHFFIETQWRDMKELEKGDGDKMGNARVKISLNLKQRGSMYDVLVSTSILIGTATTLPGVGHPLNEKWKRIVQSIVQKESREED